MEIFSGQLSVVQLQTELCVLHITAVNLLRTNGNVWLIFVNLSLSIITNYLDTLKREKMTLAETRFLLTAKQ